MLLLLLLCSSSCLLFCVCVMLVIGSGMSETLQLREGDGAKNYLMMHIGHRV